MKNKKKLAISLSIIGIIVVISLTYFILTKEDKDTTLSLIDKQWIESNKNKVIDISIVNNIPIFNYMGEGVFFDFINDIEEDTKLDFNPISYAYKSEITTSYLFQIKKEINDRDILINKDNYVLVSKNKDKYNSLKDITNVTIGVFENDLTLISKYINTEVSFKNYTTIDELISSLDTDTSLIALPRLVYLEKILSNDELNIVYDITDLKDYYVLTLGDNDRLNSIINKYSNKWLNEKYKSSSVEHFNEIYFTFKKIDETAKAKFKSKNYVYGFVSNAPYDLLNNEKLLGFNSEIIKNFANIVGIELEINKYNNINSMLNAFNENKIDFMFNNYNDYEYKMDTFKTPSIFNEKVVLISNIKNNLTINSLNSIENEVLVVDNTKIMKQLQESNINVKTYNNLNELLEHINSNSIIALDYDSYYFYHNSKLKDYKIDYEFTLKDNYSYIVRDITENKVFENYLNFYTSFINEKEAFNNAYKILSEIKPNVLSIKLLILFVTLIIIILLLIIIILKRLLFRKEKKRKNMSMSKIDKLKYVDVLTSLKNRNYLNDNIELWDDSEVYPQTIVMIDLNNIAYINDNYGHQEGDSVIKDAANILIKNQIDNTEIIRTNGNEFLIYMVGYEEKQVISHVRKILKELKDLSHGFGAAAGYSMITDAIKTIDDAVNEATIDMRSNKEELTN